MGTEFYLVGHTHKRIINLGKGRWGHLLYGAERRVRVDLKPKPTWAEFKDEVDDADMDPGREFLIKVWAFMRVEDFNVSLRQDISDYDDDECEHYPTVISCYSTERLQPDHMAKEQRYWEFVACQPDEDG